MLPPGMAITLDRDTRRYDDGRVIVGRAEGRIVRLSDAGRDALRALEQAAHTGAAVRALGRRLVDAGIAHPRPRASQPRGDVTVVVPVRDRATSLDALLAALGGGHPVLVVDDGSSDAAGVAAVCAHHGARLHRRSRSGGPAAARNAALGRIDTDLVAFIDSDCIPPPGWIERLAGHFEDPEVVAVAPRIAPRGPGATVVQRYARARSPLDLGPVDAGVGPGRRVAYVPTAALIVRRGALGDGFDEALRYGEDVDAVWRLCDAGGRVRYDPAVEVAHDEPATWRALLTRRLRYGTSAAPLAIRHPGRLAPLVVRPWPAATLAAALAGRPRAALAVGAVYAAGVARRVGAQGVPRTQALPWTTSAVGRTATATGRAATMLALPALAGALATRRLRRPAALLLVAHPLADWITRRPALDPVRWTLACVADDAAYGTGVWLGCLRERTVAPLTPAVRRGR